MSEPQHFTGRQRRLKTRAAVKRGDFLARSLITIGGLGTIVAVLLICFFLVWQVLPLFKTATLDPLSSTPTAERDVPRYLNLIDDGQLTWLLTADKQIQVFQTATGKTVSTITADQHPLSTALVWRALTDIEGIDQQRYTIIALGLPDQQVQLGLISIETEFTPTDSDQIPPAALQLTTTSAPLIHGGKLWSRTPEGFLKAISLKTEWTPTVKVPNLTSAIRYIDFTIKKASGTARSPSYQLVVVDDQGQCSIINTKLSNTGTKLLVTPVHDLKVTHQGQAPDMMRISGLGEFLYCGWKDGTLQRWDLREKSTTPEEIKLFQDPTTQLTCLEMLESRTTVLVGNSQGEIAAWFPVKSGKSGEERLIQAHQFQNHQAPITAIIPMNRVRSFISIDEQGKGNIQQVTSEKLIATIPVSPGEKILTAAASPNQEQLLTIGTTNWQHWSYSAKHADVSLKSLFLPITYEGHKHPEFIWDDHADEPAYSLTPLIYGTLKATFYSMLFGAPLALMAALFASEFLHPNVKARIKPVIELMASLPSVVLGFVAGKLFEPILDGHLPQILSSIVLVPIVVILCSYLWQLVPQRITIQAGAWRLVVIGISLIPGILLAMSIGKSLESFLFTKPIQAWLSEDLANIDHKSSAWGGWFLLLLPLSILLTWWFLGRYSDDFLRASTRQSPRRTAVLLSALNFIALLCIAMLMAAGLAFALNSFGYDPRNPDSSERYATKNSLLVGITMGFAIIPLIFTIADDALSTVPNHLRSASLGAGATQWQTAMRIVIPTALSGLFSALMIGLGRAVGETMIVLMTVGNTSIMEMNMFNGFRTLSAVIAGGILEATEGTSQYRVLALAALMLFILTFVINTIAESIRQRFRRRAYEL